MSPSINITQVEQIALRKNLEIRTNDDDDAEDDDDNEGASGSGDFLIDIHADSIINSKSTSTPQRRRKLNDGIIVTMLKNRVNQPADIDAAVPRGYLKPVSRTATKQPTYHRSSGAGGRSSSYMETRARRILGNVRKSEERSRQLLLCEEAGGGELCRMLFKGQLYD